MHHVHRETVGHVAMFCMDSSGAVKTAQIPWCCNEFNYHAMCSGLKSNLLAGFTSTDNTLLTKSVRSLYFQAEEESYLARFDRVRGFQFNLTEQVYCVTGDQLEMPAKKRKFFPGTNRNNNLGPISYPPFNSEHHHMVAWREKKEAFSAACKVACRVGGAGPEGSESTMRKPETMEPFSFHSYTSKVAAELLHSHSAVGVIDFTTGPGYVAEACIAMQIPYVGTVQTIMHETLVRRYLFKRTWDLMCESGSAHFEPQLHTLLQALPVCLCSFPAKVWL